MAEASITDVPGKLSSKLETLGNFAAEVRTGRFGHRFTFPGLAERIAFMEEQERLAEKSG